MSRVKKTLHIPEFTMNFVDKISKKFKPKYSAQGIISLMLNHSMLEIESKEIDFLKDDEMKKLVALFKNSNKRRNLDSNTISEIVTNSHLRLGRKIKSLSEKNRLLLCLKILNL